jgi:hypothetical protein
VGDSLLQVWAKSDAVVKRVKYGAPHIRAGHILMNETAAVREEGMDVVFRLTETEVCAGDDWAVQCSAPNGLSSPL